MLAIPTETNINAFEETQKTEPGLIPVVPVVRCASKWSEIAGKNAPQTSLPSCLPSLTVKQKNKEVKVPEKPTKPKPPTLSELVSGRPNVLIILRGLPGCGKTTFANFLKSQSTDKENVCIYSFNSYFEQKDGKYAFDGRRVRDAKNEAYATVSDLMKSGKPVIIVDDCNITISDVKPYIEDADTNKYSVEIVEVKSPWSKNIDELVNRCIANGHNISKEVIENMDQRWYFDMTVDSVRLFKKRVYKPKNKK